MEMAAYEQIKDARGVVERAWKKKVDERQQKFDDKIAEMELQYDSNNARQLEEFKMQTKTLQAKLREYQTMD